MKEKLNILLIVILAGAIAGLSVYFYIQYRNQKVNQITVHIFRNQPASGFIDKTALLKTVNKDSAITRRTIKEVKTKLIERQLNKNPFVAAADVFFNLTGDLIINLKEKVPIVKVYAAKRKPFYIGKDGTLFPTSKNYAPNVLISNGYISGISTKLYQSVNDSIYKTTALPAIYQLATKINGDKFLRALISQIYINSKKQIDLIPELGNQLIRFGTIADANIKLENLEAFYKEAFIKQGGNQYSQINLQYINQIVCTKK